MSKTLKHVFDQKLTFIKLYEAHLRASKGKRNRREVLEFEIDLETNLINLLNQIKSRGYRMGKYRTFVIYEPKPRLIQSLPYKDRIVHQWYVEEFIIPYFVPKFIQDTYACIQGRGTHKAVEKVQKYMRIMKRRHGHYYILKCDIQKYFYSISKDVLFSIFHRYVSDQHLLEFTKLLIYDDESPVGIPIGNYTSQYFANIYLNELDHFVKEELRIEFYVRYMDDFILLVPTKEKARYLKKRIEEYVETKLCLHLNSKSRYYSNESGVDFCGYRIYETHRLLRKRSKQKIRNLVKKANGDFEKGVLNYQKVRACYNSWKAHASHANTFHLIRKYHAQFLISDYLDL